MNISDSGSNVVTALFHVQALRLLSGIAQHAMLANYFNGVLGEPRTISSTPPTSDSLASLSIVNPGALVMYFNGVETTHQSARFLDGYNNSEGITNYRPYNSWIRNQSAQWLAALTNASLLSRDVVHLVGYSAGGCLAYDLARRWQPGKLGQALFVTTFGSPRYSHAGDVSAISNVAIARYMVDSDPVPLFPPRLTTWPPVVAVMGPAATQRHAYLNHPHGGIVLATDGTWRDDELPDKADFSPGATLAAFLYGLSVGGGAFHSLASYEARLELLQPPVPVAVPPSRRGAPAEENVNVARDEMTDQEQRVLDNITRIAREQNAVAVHVPDELRFRAVRTGRIWAVQFGVSHVCLGPTRRHAQSIARLGNEWLRRLQTGVFIDPEAIVQQLQAYLTNARDVAGDFEPKMNTQIN